MTAMHGDDPSPLLTSHLARPLCARSCTATRFRLVSTERRPSADGRGAQGRTAPGKRVRGPLSQTRARGCRVTAPSRQRLGGRGAAGARSCGAHTAGPGQAADRGPGTGSGDSYVHRPRRLWGACWALRPCTPDVAPPDETRAGARAAPWSARRTGPQACQTRPRATGPGGDRTCISRTRLCLAGLRGPFSACHGLCGPVQAGGVSPIPSPLHPGLRPGQERCDMPTSASRNLRLYTCYAVITRSNSSYSWLSSDTHSHYL